MAEEKEVLFSVIIPTYNRSKFIAKAIQSVRDQDCEDWECLIIDDGSTDNTKEIVEAFTDDRIHYIYQVNQERSAARNNGIKLANGKYICFLDSDDYMLKKHLSHFTKHFSKFDPDKTFLISNTYLNIDGKEIDSESHEIITPKTNIENIFLRPFGTQRVCISKPLLELGELFDPKINIGEDTELWSRLAKKGVQFNYTNEFTTVLVEHDSRTVNLKNETTVFKHCTLITSLLAQFSDKDVPSKNILIGLNYYYLARLHNANKKYFRAIYYSIRSILKSKNPFFKEKIYFIISNITFKLIFKD